jgi:hypothetical protein
MSQKLFDRRRLSFQQSIDLVFQLGQIILDGRQTISKSIKKYLWIAALRICAHGISGCYVMKSGAVLLILLTASPMISMFRTTAS